MWISGLFLQDKRSHHEDERYRAVDELYSPFQRRITVGQTVAPAHPEKLLGNAEKI